MTRALRTARRHAWRHLSAATLVLSIGSLASPSYAEETEEIEPSKLFQAGADALANERAADAIAQFEALGDRGVVDAVVSYDRGLAYAARIRAGADQPGDLGRAAHGFEEARDLSRDPALVAEATRALTEVRAEIARRRSRAGDPVDLEHGASLGRSIVELLPENVWALLTGLFSVALAIGILVRARATTPRIKVAGNTTCAVSGLLLATTTLVLWSARDARLHLREGVVIVPGARVLDARHVSIDAIPPIPEGTRVRLEGSGDEFTKVSFGARGATVGFVPTASVLPLAKR